MNHSFSEQEIEDLFDRLADQPTDERERQLERFPTSVRHRVRRLLDAHDELSSERNGFFEPSAASISRVIDQPDHVRLQVGGEVGEYQIERFLGVGGFGTVYLARNRRFPNQQVALKLIKSDDQHEDEIRSRFLIEGQAVSGLVHDNIARFIDGGVTSDSQAYIAMEYVDGCSISEFCAAKRLSVREVLELFCKVCHGVDHAHRNGVIHRDLKSDNILVNDDGIPKIVDFGVAKIMDARAEKESGTLSRMTAFTPEYASPEQISHGSVTVESDIYSLGVVFCEALTGCLPCQLEKTSSQDNENAIRRSEPERPSRLLKRAAATRGFAPGYAIDEDVDRITLMALQKRPDDRYRTARRFADDIDSFLDGKPIEAREHTVAYRVSRFVRRNRWFTTAVAVVAVSLLFTATATVVSLMQAKRQQRIVETTARELERTVYNLGLTNISQQWLRHPDQSLGHLGDTERFPARLRDFTWRLLRNSIDRERHSMQGHKGPVYDVAYAPDRGVLLSAGGGNSVRIWDLPTRTSTTESSGHVGWVNAIAVSSRRHVATAGEDSTIQLWSLDAPAEKVVLSGHEGAVYDVDFSPDGRSLVSAGRDGTVRLWNVDDGVGVKTFRQHAGAVFSVAFADDRIFASGGQDQTVRIWHATEGRLIRRVHAHATGQYVAHDWIMSVAFSPDHTKVASAGWMGTLTVWDAATGRVAREILQHAESHHEGAINDTEFSPDGTVIASSGVDRTIRLWDVPTGVPITVLRGHGHFVHGIAFSPHGDTLASAGSDQQVKVWRAKAELSEVISPNQQPIFAVAHSAQHKRMFVSQRNYIRGYDAETNEMLSNVKTSFGATRCLSVSPDGSTLVSGGDDGHLRFWNTSNLASQQQSIAAHAGRIEDIRFSPDGKMLASCARDLKLRIWDTATWQCMRLFTGHGGRVKSMSFSPDGLYLASAGFEGDVCIWDLSDDSLLTRIEDNEPIESVQYSHCGSMLAYATTSITFHREPKPRVVVLDTSNWTKLATLSGHRQGIFSVTFSANDDLLISCGHDRTVRIWDTRLWQERAILDEHTHWVRRATFLANDEALVTCDFGGNIRIWRAPTSAVRPENQIRSVSLEPPSEIKARKVTELGDPRCDITGLDVSPDSRFVVASSFDGSLFVWDVETGTLVQRLTTQDSKPATNAVFATSGRQVISTNYDGMRVWDVTTGECLEQRFESEILRDVAISRDARRVAVCTLDSVRLLIFPELSVIGEISIKSVRRVRFANDNDYLLAGTDTGKLQMWDLATLSLEHEVHAFDDEVTGLIETQPNQFIATSRDRRRQLAVWDCLTDSPPSVTPMHRDFVWSIAVSPNQQHFATIAGKLDGLVRIWRLEDQKRLASLPGSNKEGPAFLRFSPDGRYLIACGEEWRINVWEISDRGL